MPKTYPVTRSDAEWRKLLTPEQFHLLREQGVERPGPLHWSTRNAPGYFPVPAAIQRCSKVG